jgi:hypothetical protein
MGMPDVVRRPCHGLFSKPLQGEIIKAEADCESVLVFGQFQRR